MISFAEEVASLYYKKKKYLIINNYQYLGKTHQDKPQNGNVDIDVIAFNFEKNEINVVSCKRGSLSKEDLEKEKYLFNQHIKELKNQLFKGSGYSFKKVYVAEYITKANINFFKKENIDVLKLTNIMNKIIQEFKKQYNDSKLDGKETEVLPKTLKFLIKYSHKIDINKINLE